MVKSDQFGSTAEKKKPNVPPVPLTKPGDVVVKINERVIDKTRANSSAITCCVITTILVGMGVGIAIWYAVTEI